MARVAFATGSGLTPPELVGHVPARLGSPVKAPATLTAVDPVGQCAGTSCGGGCPTS